MGEWKRVYLNGRRTGPVREPTLDPPAVAELYLNIQNLFKVLRCLGQIMDREASDRDIAHGVGGGDAAVLRPAIPPLHGPSWRLGRFDTAKPKRFTFRYWVYSADVCTYAKILKYFKAVLRPAIPPLHGPSWRLGRFDAFPPIGGELWHLSPPGQHSGVAGSILCGQDSGGGTCRPAFVVCAGVHCQPPVLQLKYH